MAPSNPLQKLRDIDRTSPHFHHHLIDFLRGNEYQNIAPSLQGEDLTWLVDYLDNVGLHTVSPRSPFTSGIGPLRYHRFQRRPISGTTARTQKDMRRQGRSPEIVYALGLSPRICV